MSKEEVMEALKNFKNGDGVSFAEAEPEAMLIIFDALNVPYARVFQNPFPISPLFDPKYEEDNKDAFFRNIEWTTRAGYSRKDFNEQVYREFVGIVEKDDSDVD